MSCSSPFSLVCDLEVLLCGSDISVIIFVLPFVDIYGDLVIRFSIYLCPRGHAYVHFRDNFACSSV